MKRSFLPFLLLIAGSWNLLAQPPAAQTSGWRLDKGHSKVQFAIQHMVISEVVGWFKEFDITLNGTKDNFSDAQVEATIKAASINSENERRDNHLKSDDFFNAEKFPDIKFKSTKFEKTGDKAFKIYGELTIRDITKPVVFDAVLNGSVKTQRNTVTGWKATLVVNRFDYNLKWNRAIETGSLVAGETVNITLNLEFQKPVS